MSREARLLAWAAVLLPTAAVLLGVWQNSDQFARGPNAEKDISQTFIGPIDPLGDLVGISSKNAGITLTIGDKTYSNLSIQQLVLKNVGKAPITRSDFDERLRAHAKEGWEIIAIKNSDYYGNVLLSWSQLTSQEFEAKPFLLNPGDSSFQVLYLTRPDNSPPPDDESGPPIYLTVRIPNLSKFSTGDTDEWDYPPAPLVSLSLAAAVFVVLVAALIFAWYLWALLRLGLRRYSRWKLIASLVAYSTLSYATAEVVAFYLFPNSVTSWILSWYAFDIKYQWHNWLILFTQIATAGYLVYRMKATDAPAQRRS